MPKSMNQTSTENQLANICIHTASLDDLLMPIAESLEHSLSICFCSSALAVALLSDSKALLTLSAVFKIGLDSSRKGRIRSALESDNKATAKAELQKQMLRECSKLSAMGINKSTSEAVCMHMFANWFSVLVWFMLLGIEGAVIMQLIAVMNRSFSHKMNKTRQFGGFVYRLEQIMFIPATLAFMLTMFISINISRILTNLKKHRASFVNFTSCVIMDTLGTYAGATLGGPRYYEGVMMRMPSLGDSKDPDSKTPLKIYNKIRFCGIMFVCICVIIKVVMYTGMQS